MERDTKRDIIKTLLQAGRRDLAAAAGGGSVRAGAVRKRDGKPADGEPIPDKVFEAPDIDARMFWYRADRDDESAGLYVETVGGTHEFWWFGVDERKAERIARDVVDVLADTPEDEIADELKRLGGR